MRNGRVRQILNRAEATEERVMQLMAGRAGAEITNHLSSAAKN
jgi:hypothetical protein